MDKLSEEEQREHESELIDNQEAENQIETEPVFSKGETIGLQPEIVLDDDDEDEDEEEERPYLLIALCGLSVILLVSLGLLFYRFAPLNVKIAGTWVGESVGAQYKIENDKDNTTFTILNSNGVAGLDIVFKSKLTKEAANEYFVKDTKAFIRLNYELLGDEMIKNYVDNKEMFKVVDDNKKTVLLEYTKDGIAASFGDKELDTLFKYVLRDFKWSEMGSNNLNLRNDLFAAGGISFKREK